MTRNYKILTFTNLVIAMALMVALSNVLVLYLTEGTWVESTIPLIGGMLTFGAFTYPAVFFINDLANRTHGPVRARWVVLFGFLTATLLSSMFAFWGLTTWRIVVASLSAFLVAQMVDVKMFDLLRTRAWWAAPVFSSTIGSALDTGLFFSLAFAGDVDVSFANPVLGVGPELPFWVTLACADFIVKLVLAGLFLVPYRQLVRLEIPVGGGGRFT